MDFWSDFSEMDLLFFFFFFQNFSLCLVLWMVVLFAFRFLVGIFRVLGTILELD